MASNLELLPVEVLCDIVRILDPIGLLSLSQTSSRLRFIIKPNHSHLVQRLLALETLSEFGGSCYDYDPIKNEVTPAWDSPQWVRMRFTCCLCLRLLPHTSFDQRRILGLPYRKPYPESPLVSMSTIWEPSFRDKRRRRNRAKDYQKKHESEGVGHKRHQRKCYECRFQAGKANPQDNSQSFMLGTPITPVVKGRCVQFSSLLDRWFPELASALQVEQPSCMMAKSSDYPKVHYEKISWDMYMARCSGCQRWQEIRALRSRACGHPLLRAYCLGAYVDRNEPLSSNTYIRRASCSTPGCQDIDASCCNNCFAKQHGRLDLGLALVAWLKILLNTVLRDLQAVFYHWHPRSPSLRDIPQKYRSEVLKMWKVKNPRALRVFDKWTRADIRSAGLRYRRFQEILRLSEEERRIEDPTFTLTLDTTQDFDAWEASWLWYQDCLDKVEAWEKADDLLERLADFVLNRDPAALA